jgi:hypothetical protein
MQARLNVAANDTNVNRLFGRLHHRSSPRSNHRRLPRQRR